MNEVKILVGDKAYPVRYDLLTTIAERLTQDDAPLAQALMGLGIPSLNELLLGALMNNLEIIDTLWSSGDSWLRRKLVERAEFRSRLSDQQARDILAGNDRDTLETIACWSENFYGEDDEDQPRRLSPRLRDELMLHIARHPDLGLRWRLADNSAVPAAVLRLLLDDKDEELAQTVRKKLEEEDGAADE